MGFGLHTASLVLLFICFVFLLLATISAPIVEAFPLGKTASYVYGTFGYCTGGTCSTVGYPWDYPTGDTLRNWILNASTRSSLNKIVILIPITLGLTFINLISVLVLHFKNKLKVIPIVLNLLVALCLMILAIILVLLYYPNVGWMTWCILACAVLAIISFILLVISVFTQDKYPEDQDSDLTSLNNQYINNNFNEKFSNINANNISLPNTRQNDDEGFKVKAPLIISQNYTNNNSNTNANRTNTLTNTSEYNAHQPTQTNDFINKPMPANYASKNSSYYTNNDDKVSVINSVGTPVNSNKQMAPAIVANVATRSSIDDVPGPGYANNTQGNAQGNYQRQTPYPTNSVQYPANSVQYDQSVFQHHPEVEGHKPFTELDDFEVDDELANTNHNGLVTNLQLSDSESDFTSVSQRGYNSNSNNIQYPHVQQFAPSNQQFGHNDDVPPPPPSHQQSYNNRTYGPRQPNQGFQQAPAPAPAPAQQSRSDGLLNDNPDFNIVGPSKRKQNSGFVPVAARYKNQLVHGGGRPGNGTGSNSGSSPYSITR